MQQTIDSTKQHIAKLDVLRGVAILMVFLYHSQIEIFQGYEINNYKGFLLKLENESFKKILLNFIPTAFGATGVQLFLIISGFLIHYGYLVKQGKFELSYFYFRRFFRIYPPYILAVVFFAFATGGDFYLTSRQGLLDIISHLFLVHNLTDNTFFGINASFWSLALEMQLYLIYLLFLYIRDRIGMNYTTLIILFLALASTLFSIYINSLSFSASVLRYWIVWIGGAYLAEMFFYRKKIFAKHLLLLAILSLVIIGLKFTVFYLYIGVYLITLLYMIFIDYYLHKQTIKITSFEKLLIHIGICSYSLYLIHQPYLGNLINTFNFLDLSSRHFVFYSFNVMITFLVLYIISYSLYQLIELPSIAAGQKIQAYIQKKKIN